jgi:hypothetical protein
VGRSVLGWNCGFRHGTAPLDVRVQPWTFEDMAEIDAELPHRPVIDPMDAYKARKDPADGIARTPGRVEDIVYG